jgi:LuxR family maltose regulon positive regulatory protein
MPTLKTKLHRPRVPADYVARPRLLKLLDRSLDTPLTLVSAPAGYGKSTLVGAWMDGLESPGAWLSLDESDSDLATFLMYCSAAVDSLFPGVCPETGTLLSGPSVPPVTVLAEKLIADLDLIEDPFVLVLDDYGFIKEPKIHELLTRLLKQNISALHLVILTRRDPPLPLASLRAGGKMTEVRQADLKFTVDETAAFLAKAVEGDVDESAVSQLQMKTEGWPGALRLAALAMDHGEDVDGFLRELRGDTRHVQDYLVAEVLSRQPPAVRDALLKTSILDRFCAPLCRVLCAPECKGMCGPGCDGGDFMERLAESNLFCVPLDEQGEWVRYHHLFRDLLRRTLERRYGPGEIAELHERAGEWFEEKGLIEEALHHALAGDNLAATGRLVARHRHDLMNREEWHRLRKLLDLLPRGIVENSPELLMSEAWLLIGWPEMADIMTRVEALLEAKPKGSAAAGTLQGELDVMRSLLFYHVTDGAKALKYARRGLETLPREQVSVRGLAVMLQALAHQMTGDLKSAHALVYQALGEKDLLHTTYHARVLLTPCFMNHIAADLAGTIDAARRSLEFGKEFNFAECIAHGYYFLGVCHYEQNDLAAAEHNLKPVVAGPYIVNTHNFAFSAFTLALTHQAMGRPGEAREDLETVLRHALATGNSSLLLTARAFQAELALRQGRTAEVAHWAEAFSPDPFTVAYRSYLPQMTLAKWHLATVTKGSFQAARTFLSRLDDFFASTHNSRLRIDVLAMEALLHDAENDEGAALTSLGRALALAEPGGFVRPFLDLGDPMADLLERFCKQNGGGDYVKGLIEAFDGAGTPKPAVATPGPDSLPDPLTGREADVLALLSKRLRNKEIADRLSISSETVRRHTANIYQKLDVHDRRQAVERALSLRILPEG